MTALHRSISTSRKLCSRVVPAGDTGTQPAKVLTHAFKHSHVDAHSYLNAWLQQQALAPSHKPISSIQPHTLPFWVFELSINVEHAGRVGFDTRSSSASYTQWSKPSAWRAQREVHIGPDDPAVQVFASCALRRDCASAAAGRNAAHVLYEQQEASVQPRPVKCTNEGLKRDLSNDGNPCEYAYTLFSASARMMPQPPRAHRARSSREAGVSQSVHNQCIHEPFEMRRSIALEHALRAVRQRERKRAEGLLMREFNADRVSDVVVRVSIQRKRAHALRLPAYVLQYEHGKILTFSQRIVPEQFMAVVSAISGDVGAERVVSQNKARAAALTGSAASAIVTYLLMMPTEAVAHFIEWAFAGTLATTVAGVAAEAVPRLAHRRSQERRIEELEAKFHLLWEKATLDQRASESLGKLQDDVEWSRWEEQDRRHWERHQRYAWGNTLWISQHQRRRQREQYRRSREKERLRELKSKRRAQMEKEKRKQKFQDKSGYYKLLGLQGQEQDATQEQIKEAYRQQVLRMHPDKQVNVTKDEAERQFHKLRSAYEVLGDPHLRQQYHAAEEDVSR